MKKIIPLLLLLFLFAGCGVSAETGSSYKQLSMEEAISMMEKESDYILLQRNLKKSTFRALSIFPTKPFSQKNSRNCLTKIS